MPRPRKNPDDPKWSIVTEQPVNEDWKLYFAAALTGLIARGGLSSDQMIKTAKQYADEADQALNNSPLK